MPQTSSMPSEQPGSFKPVPSSVLLNWITPHLALSAQQGYHPVNKFSICRTISINPGFKQPPGLSKAQIQKEKAEN